MTRPQFDGCFAGEAVQDRPPVFCRREGGGPVTGGAGVPRRLIAGHNWR